jgi:hypothetical protein
LILLSFSSLSAGSQFDFDDDSTEFDDLVPKAKSKAIAKTTASHKRKKVGFIKCFIFVRRMS